MPRCPYNRFVHKLAFPPPPGKSVSFEDFLLICTGFPHCGPFSGGGDKTKFCGQEFDGHPDFSERGKAEFTKRTEFST